METEAPGAHFFRGETWKDTGVFASAALGDAPAGAGAGGVAAPCPAAGAGPAAAAAA